MSHSSYPYRGDSPSKKIARVTYWMQVVALAGGLSEFRRQRHLVLTSEEAGDVALLLALGVPAQSITAVEIRYTAALTARAKFPNVTVYHGDVRRIAREYGPVHDTVFLDLCSPFSPASRELVLEVASETLKNGGVLGASFFASREKGKGQKPIREISRIARYLPGITRTLARTVGQKDEANASEVLFQLHHRARLVEYIAAGESVYSLADAARFRSVLPRLAHIDHELRRGWEERWSAGVFNVLFEMGYSSRHVTPHPMSVILGKVYRVGRLAPTRTPTLHFIEAVPQDVEDFHTALRRVLPGIDINGLLNR